MSDPRDYVPSESLVRATLRGSTLRGSTPMPDEMDAWLDDDAWDAAVAAAVAYVPSEALVARTVRARPRFRLHLLAPDEDEPRRRSLGRRAAALLGAAGLSPAVLAAAVAVHAAAGALGIFLGPAWPVARGAPVATERVTLVALHAPSEAPTTSRGELAAAVRQSIAGTTRALRAPDRDRLDRTVALLRRFPTARVWLDADTAPTALAAAERVQAYLVARGVARTRAPIVARRTGTRGVTVTLDTTGTAPP